MGSCARENGDDLSQTKDLQRPQRRELVLVMTCRSVLSGTTIAVGGICQTGDDSSAAFSRKKSD